MTDSLTDQQRQVLFGVLQVAYPHDSFPEGPYQRTAAKVEEAALATPEAAAAMVSGLDALYSSGFLGLDPAAATDALRTVQTEQFFLLIHATTVVVLYDDREVWQLLGYEGESFAQGGYLTRGFDDLDWLPDPRITEYDGERVELVTDEGSR